MNSEKAQQYYVLAKRAAIVSGLLAAILAILLIANFIQTQSVDPLNSKALNQLMLQLQKDPDNQELKEQIRALDLLARKAYFTHKWQVRTGGFILFASVLVLLLSLKYISSLQMQLPELSKELDENAWENRILARKWTIYLGIGIFAMAFLAGILSESGIQIKRKSSAVKFPSPEEIEDNWPTFRGPGGNGIAKHTDVVTTWNGETGENIKWKIEIPLPGFNSPVIWGEKVFLAGADEDNQQVYCIDAKSGDMLWTTDLNDIPGHPEEAPDVTEDTGYAAPTMAVDGQRAFVIFANGDLACLDFEGQRLWGKNLGKPDNHYGHSSSLMTYKNLLLVQYDTNEGKNLFAFNVATGEPVYTTPREDIDISWASPILVNTGQRDELVLNSSPFVISYNPATGEELWRVECMDGEVAPSPAYDNGMVFVVNEYAILAGIKLSDPPEVVWEYEDDLSEAASPVAGNGLLFVASSYGTVTCFDAPTGEVLWRNEFDEGFYSSPILAGENVFLTDRDGVTHVFKAAPQFELIADNALGEKSDTIPAFMHGNIYIRGEKHLYCIGK